LVVRNSPVLRVPANWCKGQIMSREVSKVICRDCESEYKLMYDLDDTSGHPKFCPFCSAEVYDDEEEEQEEE